MSQSPLSNGLAKTLLPDMGESEFGNLKWLTWWYRLSLPPKPANDALFPKLDMYRRARLSSILLLLMMIVMAASLLLSVFGGSLFNVILMSIVLVVLIFAVLLNRAGMIMLEGLLVVGLWSVGMVLSFLALPRLDVGNLFEYDLLSVGILLAVTYFPAWSVFVVALFNCVFVWASITYMQHTPTLDQFIAQDGVDAILQRPIALMVVVMVIMYLWAQSSNHSLRRAMRAEMIARLQNDLAERDRDIAVQKMQLEHSVNKIVDTLTAYTNGDTSSRVPLTTDNVLWNIAGPINNLLNRVQRMRHAEVELDRMRPILQHARQLESEVITLRATLLRQGKQDGIG